MLGEIHGTREVPGLVAGLLTSLTDRGYHTLALEVPNDAQVALLAWARGETGTIPDFFAKPSGDGRGNAQLLELVRIAVAPPHRWQIVCFDVPESFLEKKYQALIQKKRPAGADAAQLTAHDGTDIWRERDAGMASNLLKETGSLKATDKVLAICGNIHARTTNDAKDTELSQLWPTFAAMVKEGRPAWRVRSVNVELFGGSYFNNGKVQTVRPARPLEQAVVRPGAGSGWDLILSLPEASPATFLRPVRTIQR
jgi:hypothetical protein